jgi:hypothetical protein
MFYVRDSRFLPLLVDRLYMMLKMPVRCVQSLQDRCVVFWVGSKEASKWDRTQHLYFGPIQKRISLLAASSLRRSRRRCERMPGVWALRTSSSTRVDRVRGHFACWARRRNPNQAIGCRVIIDELLCSHCNQPLRSRGGIARGRSAASGRYPTRAPDRRTQWTTLAVVFTNPANCSKGEWASGALDSPVPGDTNIVVERPIRLQGTCGRQFNTPRYKLSNYSGNYLARHSILAVAAADRGDCSRDWFQRRWIM